MGYHGDGPDLEELVFIFTNWALNKISCLPAGKQGRRYLICTNNAIFFLPSITEGIANVVLEAMSMELPVVSTNAGRLGGDKEWRKRHFLRCLRSCGHGGCA